MVHLPIHNTRLSILIFFVFLIASNNSNSAETDLFNVITVIKDKSYPWYEKALDTVYEVNGEQGRSLVLTRDQPYIFKINTGLRHDFYFSKNESGRGAGVITTGIKNQFIHKGIIRFTPTSSTPKELYYQCQNHPYMGGKIYIIDEGEQFTPPPPSAFVKVEVKPKEKQVVSHNEPANPIQTTPQELAQQRVGQASTALNASAERIANSQNDKAKALLNRAWAISEDANAWLSGGDITTATEDADIVLMLINAAENQLP